MFLAAYSDTLLKCPWYTEEGKALACICVTCESMDHLWIKGHYDLKPAHLTEVNLLRTKFKTGSTCRFDSWKLVLTKLFGL